ncbi:NAD-dependent epimerase/dehydratase family protein [bacterium]|nr:NAD-dependent epimerase/dehydratase family protein [candidate division CSSED10-310 bacterium]
MRILITGVAGFIGSHLAERVLADGHDVVGVDCFTDYYARETKELNLNSVRHFPGFKLIEANIVDADLDNIFKGIDIIYHLAAQAGVRSSWGANFRIYSDYNILGTQRVLESSRRTGVKRLVYASSSSVYGDVDDFPMHESVFPRPVSPYGVSKLAGENLCVLYAKNYNLSTVSLRYFTVYGPRQRPDMAFHKFIRSFLCNQTSVLYGSGDQTRDFTFVSDAVDATYMAGLKQDFSGDIFNIGGGSRISVNSVLNILEGILGGPLDIRRCETQKGDVRHTAADTSAAKAAFGYIPKVSLEKGLEKEVDWLKSVYCCGIGG